MRILILRTCVGTAEGFPLTLRRFLRGQIHDIPSFAACVLVRTGRAVLCPQGDSMRYHTIPFLRLDTPPIAEPLTLEETKLYLRVDSEDEDDLITSLITVARQAAETYMRRSILTQSWVVAFDDYAPAEVNLPRGPVQEITSVKLISQDGGESIVSSATYYLSAGREKLCFNASPIGHIVEILYVTGYEDASDVPAAIKQGMLAHIAELFENRPGSVALPASARGLYNPYRVVSL